MTRTPKLTRRDETDRRVPNSLAANRERIAAARYAERDREPQITIQGVKAMFAAIDRAALRRKLRDDGNWAPDEIEAYVNEQLPMPR